MDFSLISAVRYVFHWEGDVREPVYVTTWQELTSDQARCEATVLEPQKTGSPICGLVTTRLSGNRSALAPSPAIL